MRQAGLDVANFQTWLWTSSLVSRLLVFPLIRWLRQAGRIRLMRPLQNLWQLLCAWLVWEMSIPWLCAFHIRIRRAVASNYVKNPTIYYVKDISLSFSAPNLRWLSVRHCCDLLPLSELQAANINQDQTLNAQASTCAEERHMVVEHSETK